uniref:Transposase n=1 Tax=Ascaris lumbricoides TaxID=6252 RepID=A0A0M3IBM7_ASCLU
MSGIFDFHFWQLQSTPDKFISPSQRLAHITGIFFVDHHRTEAKDFYNESEMIAMTLLATIALCKALSSKRDSTRNL